jgi:hypothetical protein
MAEDGSESSARTGVDDTKSSLEVGQCGPAGRYTPSIKVVFVRRREYGMSWPGAVYPGDEARERYVRRLRMEAGKMGIELGLREQPLYDDEETDRWLNEVESDKPDGLLLILQDRHGPAWHAANGAAELGIPTVIFCVIGASFTTNTRNFKDRAGAVIYSAPEFDQAIFGLKMLAALARMRRTRCLVLHGDETYDERLADTGIELRHLPESTYVEAYKGTEVSPAIRALAKEYEERAEALTNAGHQDVVNAARGYAACARIIKEHEGDAITMDCLGMGRRNPEVTLPCLAWSRLNDMGVPAICEADQGAIVSHLITHYLFDHPGFQQDPVADTDHNSVIGAHCSCPTRLDGYDAPARPFNLSHHHGLRDVTTETLWERGRRVTSLDVYPGSPSKLEVATGEVIDQLSVPPHGGCVISVNVKFDGVERVRDFPGFHQVWFYGDYGDELEEFAQLSGFDSERI